MKWFWRVAGSICKFFDLLGLVSNDYATSNLNQYVEFTEFGMTTSYQSFGVGTYDSSYILYTHL